MHLAPTAYITFILGLSLSALLATFQFRQIDNYAKQNFERLSYRTEAEVTGRLERALQGARGLRSVYAATDQSLRREVFRRAVESHRLDVEFPGVRGFGFIQRLAPAQQAEYVKTQRADGAPEFAIRQFFPNTTQDLFVVSLVEPLENNQGALGIDVGSEPQRRASIQQAINTGAPTVSATITLVQDKKKTPGILLFLPVYRHGAPIDVPRERRAALIGLIYAPIVMQELLQGMQDVDSGMMDLEILDSPINTPGGTLMFDARPEVSGPFGLSGRSAAQNASFISRYSIRKPMQLPGRSVTLITNSTPAFEAGVNSRFPWWILGGGLLISTLLAMVVQQHARAREKAEALANAMTHDLQIAVRDNEALVSTLELHSIVSVTDRDGRIIAVNDAFCNISGYSREALLGHDHRIVNSGTHPPEFWEDMWKTIASGLPWRGQLCNRARNGETYWVDTLIAPFIGDDGRIEKYVSIRIDITASKHAEHALISASEAAQQASLAKTSFLANMSHEIRTPMNAILGMLKLLRGTELTRRQADYAEKSESAARSLLGLLNDVLDYSKIEAGRMEVDNHAFGVDRLLRDLSVILSANVGDKPIDVVFDLDPEVPRQLEGDAMRLHQVLLNLVSNAIKFTSQGTVLLSIQVLKKSNELATLQFSVQDTGIGIAPENQARIFSGFTQAESSTTRRYGGTGLGLVISQRLVALMGGDLALESIVGVGSRFYFTVTLPIAPDNRAVELQRSVVQAEALSKATDWRVLVIDDNPVARDVLGQFSASFGWKADLAESGAQALDCVRSHALAGIHYRAIFIDWRMPEMDGWQTARALRECLQALAPASGAPTMPVFVMVSANSRDIWSQEPQTVQALVDCFLVKPITPSMVLNAVIDAHTDDQPLHPSHAQALAQRRLVGMRLLLVEDNLNNQQVACELLEAEGAHVSIANHGAEALELLRAPTGQAPGFDVVMMDLQMPVMDGFSATRAIRSDLGLLKLPIVAMTANAMASDRLACLQAGMNDHVGKPFDLNHLVRVLRLHAGWDAAADVSLPALPALGGEALEFAQAQGIELRPSVARLGGKIALYQRMLEAFIRDWEALLAPLEDSPPEAAKRIFHTIKGLSAAIGASELAALASSAEKAMGSVASDTAAEAEVQARQRDALRQHGTQLLPALHGLLVRLRGRPDADAQLAAPAISDLPELQAQLRALAALLADDDMHALEYFAALVQRFGGTLDSIQSDAMAAARGDLERALSELDFADALSHCQRLLAACDHF